MLALFFGNDTIRARQAAHDHVESKKDEGFSPVTVEADGFEAGYFRNASAAASLFGERTVHLIDTPSEEAAMYAEAMESLPAMAESADVFVVIEGPLVAAERKRFEKYAEKAEEYKKSAATRFNNFALADALAKKDKRSLWLLLSEARLEGVSDEELIGVLWWQLKTMRLSAVTSSAAEAGSKDFPYNKAKRALAKFGVGELERLSHSLLSLTHDSRLGRHDLDHALERWILEL